MPINWIDVPDPKNPPPGAIPASAANLSKLAVVADFGVAGTPTGDALSAAFAGKGGTLFNVKDYGAVGNYNTSTGTGANDTTAINNAVAAAAAVGGTAYFPVGTYKTTTGLVLPSGVGLLGERADWFTPAVIGSRIYCASPVPAVTNADQTNGNHGIRINRMRFYGNGSGTVNVMDFRGTGGNPCHGIYIKECTVENGSNNSIYLDHVMESEIVSNYLLNAAVNGIQMETCTDNLIEANQIDTNQTSGGDGIWLHHFSDVNIIRGNFVFFANHGIILQAARRNIVANNRFNTNRREGIYLVSTSGVNVCQYNLIQGNQCYDNGTSGAGSRAGILLDGSADHNIVVDNVSGRSAAFPADPSIQQLSGVVLASTVANNYVAGNFVSNNGGGAGSGIANTSTAGGNVLQNNYDASTTMVSSTGVAAGVVSQTLSTSGAVTIDASAGNHQRITLSANATSSTISNPTQGQPLTVTWVQDATGGRTYAWPANCKFAGGSAPADTTASKRTSVTVMYDGTNWNEISRAVAVG